MLFWIIAFLLSAVVAASLALPLLRQRDDAAPGSEDMVIYRDQLAEVDRDLARGVLDPADAERTRTEIARRLIAADRAGGPRMAPAPRKGSVIVGVATALVLVGGSLWLYADLGRPGERDLPRSQRLAEAQALRDSRPSQAEAEAMVLANRPELTPEAPAEYLEMIAELRDIVPTRPDDLEGWQLLALHEARLGQYVAATRAQERVVALKGDTATQEDLTGLIDRMVAATRGYVSPEAEEIANRLFAMAADNTAALYYAGLLHAQTDRPDLAFALWRRVVERGAPGGLHTRLARGQIEDVAFLAGRAYTLPPEQTISDQPGPSAADMEAAADMSPDDRDAMVRGMVAQLADRLNTQGGPPEDWARLIAAYGVLGDADMAGAIWAEAQIAFGASEAAMEILRTAARQAGVAE
jgi:cytochrome c-type biogenesis protein CcmH